MQFPRPLMLSICLLALVGCDHEPAEHHPTAHASQAEEPKPAEQKEPNVEAKPVVPAPELAEVYEAYFQIQWALSRDDAERASQSYQLLLDSISGTESQADLRRLRSVALQGQQGEQTLPALRKNFAELSEVLLGLTETAGISDEKLYVQYCPMAFGSKSAQWMQRTPAIENPYLGSQMFECGVTKRKLVPEATASEAAASMPAANQRKAP